MNYKRLFILVAVVLAILAISLFSFHQHKASSCQNKNLLDEEKIWGYLYWWNDHYMVFEVREEYLVIKGYDMVIADISDIDESKKQEYFEYAYPGKNVLVRYFAPDYQDGSLGYLPYVTWFGDLKIAVNPILTSNYTKEDYTDDLQRSAPCKQFIYERKTFPKEERRKYQLFSSLNEIVIQQLLIPFN